MIEEELDRILAPVDALLAKRYPGDHGGRQPVHTIYVPADQVTPAIVEDYGEAALHAVHVHGPLGYAKDVRRRVSEKLRREPIEDLRIDFEDGYGIRDDAEEDAAARAAGDLAGRLPVPFIGLRCKSLEARTRRRAIRTLQVFLDALGTLPSGFVVTLPKVSAVEQVRAMVVLCGHLDADLKFEIQIETPPAVLGADGTATVAQMIQAAEGRCTGLHYGTYDYSAATGVAAAYQSLDHAVADYAKAVMQVAAAGTGVRLSDGSTNILPVGDREAVRRAWRLHSRLVRRSLERGFYQGWDLHPAQLPTRYGATYTFFQDGLAAAEERLEAYLQRRSTGILDEPATARALAGFLLRGLDCGAFETTFDRAELERL
jgi:citrate lyase beta subunit